MRIRLIKAPPVGAVLLPAVCPGLPRPTGPPPRGQRGRARGRKGRTGPARYSALH